MNLTSIGEKLRVKHSFAGCNSRNKSITSTPTRMVYSSASNIIESDYFEIQNITHFENKINCVNSLGESIICGDVVGNGYVMHENKIFKLECKECIQDCCFSGEIAIFATFNRIFFCNFNLKGTEARNGICMMDASYTLYVEQMINSICAVGGNLLVGSNLGKLDIYSISNTQGIVAKHIQGIDAHMDAIKCISFNGTDLIGTCSQDTNVKIWKFSEESFSLLQTLNGHNDWVNSLKWNNQILYSASSDKTIRIWESNPNYDCQHNNFYICADIIGGASEYYGVEIFQNRVFTQCKTGGIDKQIENEYFISGHQNEITDLDWKGQFLASCSFDNTARIFYRGKECARPQIHGFPLTSIKFLPGEKLQLISAAQETILRMYEATQEFFMNCEDINESTGESDLAVDLDQYSKSAHLCELNLTNEVDNELEHEPLSENSLSTKVFKEIKKIYGHYFEIKNIAVCKNFIASCNRSSTKNFGGLFIWDLNGEKKQYIAEHDLGIQKISISPDCRHIVTVSRDKSSCFYNIDSDLNIEFVRKFADHERIVWDCGFSPDSAIFGTCSRDGKVVLRTVETLEMYKSHSFDSEITCMDFHPFQKVIALATDNGNVLLVDYELRILDEIKALSKKANVIKFNEQGTELAVGGSDSLLRIFDVQI